MCDLQTGKMIAGFSLSIWKIFSFSGRLLIALTSATNGAVNRCDSAENRKAQGIRIERIAESLIPDSEHSKTLVGLLELLEFYAVFFQ